MKSIIKSLLIVTAVAAVAGGATYAVFSAQSKFTGNTISTAKVNIDARSEPQGRLPKPLVASGLVPGKFTDYARGIVFNQADSTNVRLYMYIDNIQSSAGSVCDKTNIQVWTGNAASGADSERGFLLMNSSLAAYAGNANRVEITGDSRVFVAPNYLPANTSAVIQQRAQLDPSADNAQENATCTWDEVFVAETP